MLSWKTLMIFRALNQIVWPFRKSTGSCLSFPTRILGPGRSMRMGQCFPASWAALRILRISWACWGKVPWAKLSRAIPIPARISSLSLCSDRDAGPMVQTILVLECLNLLNLIGNPFLESLISLPLGQMDYHFNEEGDLLREINGTRPTL